jgi:hypothetical protein
MSGEVDMGDIKSAREIAMERIEKIGTATPEERMKWKYVPDGEKLAARYLKREAELTAEINKFDKQASKYIVEGVSTVLIKNIGLPKDDITKNTTKRAMDGLKVVKTDKGRLESIFNQIKHVFNHYAEQGEQQRKQAYAQLKADFQVKYEQAVRQQMGSNAKVKVDIEKHPQFLEEWYKMRTQLDEQYYTLLDEYKQELTAIS